MPIHTLLQPPLSCSGITAPDSSSCLFIPGRIGGKQVDFLVDTGCSHSLLSKTVFDRLPVHVRNTLQTCENTASLADGGSMVIYGRIKVSGRLRNVEFHDEFLVCKIADDAILGMSFLRKQECTLACARGVLIIGSETIPCTDRMGNLLTNDVQVIRQVTLPPGTESQVHCKLVSEPNQPVSMVERYVQDDRGMVVTAVQCETDTDRKVMLRCTNTTDGMYSANTCSPVGLCQPVMTEVTPEQSLALDPAVPDHLAAMYGDAGTICTTEQKQRLAQLLVDCADGFRSSDATPAPDKRATTAAQLNCKTNLAGIITLQTQPGTATAVMIQHVKEGTTLTAQELGQASPELKRLSEVMPFMRMQGGTLQVELRVGNRKRWCCVCPTPLRQSVIRETHRLHHSGINKTLQRVRMTWYWPGMVAEVRRTVRSCEICQAAKHRNAVDLETTNHGRSWPDVRITNRHSLNYCKRQSAIQCY
jgi:hypothetical protein